MKVGADTVAEVVAPKSFLGMQIVTLYDFFWVFIILAGVASLILFGLSKTLQKNDARHSLILINSGVFQVGDQNQLI